MKLDTDQPKSPESKPGLRPDAKNDLKSLPMAELQTKEEGCSRCDFCRSLEDEKRLIQKAVIDN